MPNEKDRGVMDSFVFSANRILWDGNEHYKKMMKNETILVCERNIN